MLFGISLRLKAESMNSYYKQYINLVQYSYVGFPEKEMELY